MKNEYLKNIPISILIITFLYFCGVLYLIGYWSTFEFDVFSLISIYDIPKSFVFPLMITQLLFMLNYTVSTNIFYTIQEQDENKTPKAIKPQTIFKRIIVFITSFDLWWSLAVMYIITNYHFLEKKWIFWFIAPLILSYYSLYRFVKLDIIKSNIKHYTLRLFIGHILIFFPIFSFSIGKLKSLAIYQNAEITTIKISNIDKSSDIIDTTSLKFLGFISDRVIYGSLDNNKIYVSNKDAYNTVLLIKNKKK